MQPLGFAGSPGLAVVRTAAGSVPTCPARTMKDASTELPRPATAKTADAITGTPHATLAAGATAPPAAVVLKSISDTGPVDLPPLSPTAALLHLLGLPEHTDTGQLARLLTSLRDMPASDRAPAVRASGLLDQATSPDLAPDLVCAVVLRLAAAPRINQWIRELEGTPRG